MSKLIILQGTPASGKSTYARTLAEENPDKYVIVCRDDIRTMLGTYWVPKREKLVTKIETNSVKSGLINGYDVILDATNLNPSTLTYFTELVDKMNLLYADNIKIKYKIFKIPLWKAIFRDWKRGIFGRSVGKTVITNFYNRYYGKQ